MDYTTYLEPKETKATEIIPGREEEMTENLAGAYSFKADDLTALRRWLLTGSMGDGYYQNKNEMTSLNIKLLAKCVDLSPLKTVREIKYASDYGINNHTPILAMVYLSMGGFIAKKEFRNLFNQVIRTASHLYEFMSYTKALRGMGKTIHKAILNWINKKEIKELEYQFLKYQNRYGWTGRDVLRMVKPKPTSPGQDIIFGWMVGKYEENSFAIKHLERITAYEKLKAGGLTSSEVAKMISDLNLTHEMIPANITRDEKVWMALYETMPIGATLRNLGNLTDKGMMKSIDGLSILRNRFTEENIKRARLHPLTITSAFKIYMAGGELGRSKLTWKPNSMVEDVLENAIETAFQCLEPTNKFFFHGVDISSSMTWGSEARQNTSLFMRPMEIAGIMALATIKAENNYYVGGFSDYFIELSGLRKGTSFRSVIEGEHLKGLTFGGTDAGLAFRAATEMRQKVDTFVLWTDSESWMGNHPSQSLAEYRNKVNPEAKAIYITLVPYSDQISLVDPKDKKSYDIAGFSNETIKLIQMIAEDKI